MSKLVKRIICFAVMAVITVALIVGNIVAFVNANTVTAFLSGTGEDYSNAQQELAAADELCQLIEEESIVLLKNENDALPLKETERYINVFGYGATENGFLLKGVGSGSSTINDAKKVSLLKALEDEGIEYNQDIIDICENVSGVRPASPSGSATYNLKEASPSAFSGVLDAAKERSGVAMLVLSRDGGENIGEIPKTQSGNSNKTYLDITDAEEDLLEMLVTNFDKVIVVLNTTNTMHLGFLEQYGVDACIYVGITGQSGARAIPRILKGYKEVTNDNNETEKVVVTPSGKITDIITYSSAVTKQYDPTYVNNEVVSSSIQYVDDIYYGYKWYETADAEGYFSGVSNDNGTGYKGVVQYPFGYGLSYTDFEWELMGATYKDGTKSGDFGNNSVLDNLSANAEITVTVRVTNTGEVEGKEVVELYYKPEYIDGGIEKAEINLLDFEKTEVLKPGQAQDVHLTFTPYDMASYDCYDKNDNGSAVYELDKGTYSVQLMTDSHNLAKCKDGKSGVLEYKVNSTIIIDEDPWTGAKIENRFTGSTAYTGVPVDGSTAGVETTYLSRSDFAATFPTTRAKSPNSSEVNKSANYLNDAAYADVDTNITTGADNGLYLWTLEGGDKASLSQLNGTSQATLAVDNDLIATLAENYDSDTWEELLDQMTVSEMKKLVECGGFRREAVASVGLRQLYDYDGPAGFNTNSRSGSGSGEWTAYPSEALMGCSWNKTLMFSLGRSMGAEANKTNIHGWYAPGVNLHRSAYTARNFEYYSEDAVLSGKLCVQVIAGAKTNGLTCYLKHFACSEPGPNPGGVNTWLTEQNLRENYLRPFEIAVRGIDVDLSERNDDGSVKTENIIHVGANSLMTAFNRVGASWAGANYAMNVQVLREEWGFNGTLITDWTTGGGTGGMNPAQGVRAQNDLWLNPNDTNGSPLNSGNAIDMYCARVSSHNILYTVADTLNCYNIVKAAAEKGVNLDSYQTELIDGFKVVTGWWQPVVIIIDVLVALGFVAWGLQITVGLKNLFGKKAKQGAGAEAGENTSNPDSGDNL